MRLHILRIHVLRWIPQDIYMKQTLIVYTDKQHKTMLTLMLNRNKLCFVQNSDVPLPSFGMS